MLPNMPFAPFPNPSFSTNQKPEKMSHDRLSTNQISRINTRPTVTNGLTVLLECVQWRRVQYLANQSWIRWKREHLQNLQVRSKWNLERRYLIVGDIVLGKDDQANRNNWPLGKVVEASKIDDGKVRKATVLICRDRQKKMYDRPISALVLLVPSDNSQSVKIN